MTGFIDKLAKNHGLFFLFTLETNGPITSCFREVSIAKHRSQDDTSIIALKAHTNVKVNHILVLGG